MATACANKFEYTRQLSLTLIDEKEIKAYSKVDASKKLTTLKLTEQDKLTTLIKGCLPPTHGV